MKYRAFISYSHRDRKWGDWLHKALETYRVPKTLVGLPSSRGEPVPARAYPVFRDREELPTSTDLGEVIGQALAESRYLIVICSPRAARSRWVNEEILQFKRLGRENRILALIVAGEPNAADGKPGFTVDDECFPEALKFKMGPDGNLSSDRTEPIAADARPDRDGKTNALLKLLAGLLGVDYDALKRRDETRRKRRQRLLLSSSLGLILLFAGISAAALWQWREAETQRIEAEIQTERAERGEAAAIAERNSARIEEGYAWLERARAKEADGETLPAALFAAKAIGFEGLGRETAINKQLLDAHPPLLTLQNSPEGYAEARDLVERLRSTAGSAVLVWSNDRPEDFRPVLDLAPTSNQGWRFSNRIPENKAIEVWEVGDNEVLRFVTDGDYTCAAFNADGSLLACGYRDGMIKVWDLESEQELATFRGHSWWINSVVFSPDGTRLASGSEDKIIRVWDMEAKTELVALEVEGNSGRSVAFSPNGELLAAEADEAVQIWETATWRELGILDGHTKRIKALHFDPVGHRLASGSSDWSIKIWDLVAGREPITLTGHSGEVLSVKFSPDGRLIATGSTDGTVKLWNATNGNLLNTLKGHSDSVNVVAFSLDGFHLASGSRDGTTQVWEVSGGRMRASLDTLSEGVRNLTFSSDGNYIISGASDGSIHTWDAGLGSAVSSLTGHSDWNLTIAFSSGGTRMAGGFRDGMVKVWHVQTGREIISFSANEKEVLNLTFSPDGNRLAVGYERSLVIVWDVETGEDTLMATEASPEVAFALAFSPDGRQLAGGFSNHIIKLWEIDSGKEVATLIGHSNPVFALTFCPDGTRIASGGWDDLVKVWDVRTRKELMTFSGHKDVVNSVAFSPDGKTVASGSGDRMIHQWDVESGRKAFTYSGHTDEVRRLAFSPDGAYLASGSRDGTIKVWERKTADPPDLFSLLDAGLLEISRQGLAYPSSTDNSKAFRSERRMDPVQPNWNTRSAINQFIISRNLPAALANAQADDLPEVLRAGIDSTRLDLPNLHFRATQTWAALKPYLLNSNFDDPQFSLAAQQLYFACMMLRNSPSSDLIREDLRNTAPVHWIKQITSQLETLRLPRQIGGHLSAKSMIEEGRYYETYSFKGDVGERVRIDLLSDEFDPFLIVLAPSGEIWQNDDWEGNQAHSRLDLILPSTGDYRISVTSYEAGETGDYILKISGLPTTAEVMNSGRTEL